MYKNLKISSLTYEMLCLIARKANKKTEDFLEALIQDQYNKTKK